jgi:transposase
MGAKRRQFTREFKLEAVRLVVEEERSAAEVGRELGVRADTLRRWVESAAGRAGLGADEIFPGPGKRSGKDAELYRLRAELELVKQERDFLKKAAAYFASQKR